jgi:hypothetical protein
MATAVLIPQISNDVTVYARHVPDCKNTSDRKQKDCTCPKWVYIKATQKRSSARTRSWQVAESVAQKLRDSYDPDKARIAELEAKQERNRVLLDEAVDVWLNHKRADNVKESSVQTYRWTLRRFADFAKKFGANYVHEISAPLVTNWKNTTITEHRSSQRKKRGHLRDFFRFWRRASEMALTWWQPGICPNQDQR